MPESKNAEPDPIAIARLRGKASRRVPSSLPKRPVTRNRQPLVSGNLRSGSIEEFRLRDDFLAKMAFSRNYFRIVEDRKVSVSSPFPPGDDVLLLSVGKPIERHAIASAILIRDLALLCPRRIPTLKQSVVISPRSSANVAEEPHLSSFSDLPIGVFLLVRLKWNAAAQLLQLLIQVIIGGPNGRRGQERNKDCQ